jgi:hypothetical protein
MTDSSSSSSSAAAVAAVLSPARWVVARTGLDVAPDLCEPLLELIDDEEEAHPQGKHGQLGNLAAMHRGSLAKQQERLSTLEYQPSEDNEEEESVVLFSLWDYLCLVIILPTLLVVQFRMALRISRTGSAATTTTAGTDTGSLHWLVVDKALPLWIVIALYVISALLYKICLQDLYRLRRIKIGNPNHDSTGQPASWWTLVWTSCLQQLVLLLPEVLMDLVLGVVWYVSAEAAAVVLVWATIVLSGLVIVGSVHTLWHYYHNGITAANDPNTNGIDLEMDASQRDGILRIPLTE